MLQNNIQPTDPIVEILRLAYRRGLAIQQEEKSKTVNVQPSDGDDSMAQYEEDLGKETKLMLGN